MKLRFFLISLSVFSLFLPVNSMVVHTYCKDKDETIRTESGKFNEDYLFAGHELNFSGEAEDLIFLGKRLTFTGKTQLGLITLTGSLVYSGECGNGIIAAGSDMVIDGKVNGNSYMAGKSVRITDKGNIRGNLFAGCAKLTIDGPLTGDLYAAAAEITINSEISGNVYLRSGRIIIGDKGKIIGNLSYASKEKLNADQTSKVSGTVKIDQSFNAEDWNSLRELKKSIGYIIGFALYISFVVISLLLLFIPVFSKLDFMQSGKAFWKTSLWGLVPLLMYPAIIVLSFVFVITIPFAIILLLSTVPLFFFANLIGTTLIGKQIIAKLKWNISKRHLQFLIGMVPCTIVSLIPFINFLGFLFITSLGFGIFLSFLFNRKLTES